MTSEEAQLVLAAVTALAAIALVAATAWLAIQTRVLARATNDLKDLQELQARAEAAHREREATRRERVRVTKLLEKADQLIRVPAEKTFNALTAPNPQPPEPARTLLREIHDLLLGKDLEGEIREQVATVLEAYEGTYEVAFRGERLPSDAAEKRARQAEMYFHNVRVNLLHRLPDWRRALAAIPPS